MSTTQTTSSAALLDELVHIVGKIGGGVRTGELEYQLRRRGHALSAADVVDLLCEAEAHGLVTPYAWTLGPEAQR
jgi:hypothetical protein